MAFTNEANPLAGRTRLVYAVAAVVICVSLLGVFWAIQQRRRAEVSRLQQIHTIGKSWEKSGRLPEADYVRVRRLKESVLQTGSISDHDLDWALGLLGGKSDDIVHARVLGILGELKTVPATQRKRIEAALQPLRWSTKALDKAYVRRVRNMLAKTIPS